MNFAISLFFASITTIILFENCGNSFVNAMSFFLNVNYLESKSVLDVLIEIFLYTKHPAANVINKIKNINLFGYVKTQLINEFAIDEIVT